MVRLFHRFQAQETGFLTQIGDNRQQFCQETRFLTPGVHRQRHKKPSNPWGTPSQEQETGFLTQIEDNRQQFCQETRFLTPGVHRRRAYNCWGGSKILIKKNRLKRAGKRQSGCIYH